MASQGPERKNIFGDRVVDVYSDSGEKIGEITKSDGLLGEKTEYHKLSSSYSGGGGGGDVGNIRDTFVAHGAFVAICVGLFFGSCWVINHATQYSFFWWLSLVVGLGSGIVATGLFLFLGIALGIILLVFWLISYFFNHPW